MSSYKLLVVDDDPTVIALITEVLSKRGYSFMVAYNGASAYNKALAEIPDLILLDWDMPVLNGYEALVKLKSTEETKDIPVIMLTGVMNSDASLQDAFTAGVNDFVSKPINAVELVSRTKALLKYDNYFKSVIKQKEWELALITKNLVRNNEFNSRIITKLEKLNEQLNSNQQIEEILIELKNYVNIQNWEQFETYFNTVNPDFVKNLFKKHPGITPNELKLCIFLRLNLNSKQISSITYQNLHSIDIARYRLRKKLGLKHKEKLNAYLLSI